MRYIQVVTLRAGSYRGQARHSCSASILDEVCALLERPGVRVRNAKDDASVLLEHSGEFDLATSVMVRSGEDIRCDRDSQPGPDCHSRIQRGLLLSDRSVGRDQRAREWRAALLHEAYRFSPAGVEPS